ncbi:MAG: HEAT repeat domain-containing protein [Gemmataceae bacterium]
MDLEALDAWRKHLKHGHTAAQYEAIAQLEAACNAAADGVLIEALSHGDEWVVARAAAAVGRRLCRQAVPKLVELASDEHFQQQINDFQKSIKQSPDATGAAVAAVGYSFDMEEVQIAARTALQLIEDQSNSQDL